MARERENIAGRENGDGKHSPPLAPGAEVPASEERKKS